MIHLENMRPWEKIEMVVKRHWIALVLLWFYAFLALKIVLIVFLIMWFSWLSTFLVTIFITVFIVFIYIEWINVELDLFIVTNNRIVWVDQISFLNRTVTECNLWQVQEVNSQTKWILANIFNFWTIDIQTAWATTTLTMWLAPEALKKSRIILNIVDAYRDSHQNQNPDLLWYKKGQENIVDQ